MPSFRHEKRCAEAGAIRIAGVDEVGRGPLAGPVVAAVAVIDRTLAKRKLLRLIDDSKKLTLEEREEAYAAILESGAVRYAVGEASVEEIDAINILRATFREIDLPASAFKAPQPVVRPNPAALRGRRAVNPPDPADIVERERLR